MKEEHRQLLQERMGQRAGNSLVLLESLYFRPVFTIDHVKSVTGLTYTNANTLVRDLCEVCILTEITGQKRNRAFSYAPYLAFFS